METIKKQALGRGLSALFETETVEVEGGDSFVAIERIALNPYQPRKKFDVVKLQELSDSIREKGVLQPLLVRPLGDNYELIAGERRLRAAEQAGLRAVPCRVFSLTDEESLEISLLENIQRADLNCLEEAAGYLRLINEFSYTQEKLAEKLGKSRSHIANSLRLLQLPEEVQSLLWEHAISPGHGRCLAGVENPGELASLIVLKGLSVRQTEALARKQKVERSPGLHLEKSEGEDAVLAHQLSELTGLRSQVCWKGSVGTAQFFMENPSDFDKLLGQLTRGKEVFPILA